MGERNFAREDIGGVAAADDRGGTSGMMGRAKWRSGNNFFLRGSQRVKLGDGNLFLLVQRRK